MSGFLIAAAALVAVSLLFLLFPLLRRPAQSAEVTRTAINAQIYRDQMAELDRDLAAGSLSQADHEEGRRELQRRLLEEAGAEAKSVAAARRAGPSALLVGLFVPLAAGLLYFTLGNLAGLSPEQARPAKVTAQEIEDMVARLAARLEQRPDDPKGWVMLARSYKAMGRYEESTRAFDRAGALVQEDPNLLTDYAEALALATGGSLRGRPSELIARALELDPAFPDALVLAGTAAYEREDYAAAAVHWERLLGQLPTDSADAQALSESIRKARALAQKQARKQPAPRKTP